MLGAIIGDIAGSRFEFKNFRTKHFTLFHPKSRLTDDSAMTLALAGAVMETDSQRPQRDAAYYDALRENAVRWMREYGKLYPGYGYGGNFAVWLFCYQPRPYNSFGNGAAMRVSPAGWAARTEEEALLLADALTDVTHNHPEGIKGARATALCIYLARTGASQADIRGRIEKDYYKLDFTIDQIRPTYSFNETCQGTVPQAIQCFLESVDFEDTVRTAVSLGGDSDTVAAIAGSIGEAYFGIPDSIRDQALPYMDERQRSLYLQWAEAHPAPERGSRD